MKPIISVDHLKHYFGAHAAIQDLTFHVGEGEIFGLLGPNGAGKTTTVRLLNGLYKPSAGEMCVMGFDPVIHGEEVRRRTGVLTETPALYERLTAWQNLDFFAELSDLGREEKKTRIQELLTFFDLTARAHHKVGTFSKGMKQRLALARALLGRPEMVFLDEPTSGLDPESAQQVHELISNLRQNEHHTVFLCTHNLFEAQRLCDRLGIMNKGRLLASGTLAELRQLVSPGLWVQIDFWQAARSPLCLDGINGVLKINESQTSLRVQVKEEAVIPTLITDLVRQGAQILSVTPQQVSLEEIYFTLQNQNNGQHGGAQ
jgi:ABC-2 type transport system ATP-binding protein